MYKRQELHHGISISEDAVNYSAKLADRYISDKCLPDKAIDLIDEAAAQLKIESNKKPEIILQQENRIHTINQKLNNLLGENIEETEKLLNIRKQSGVKLNILFDNWNNLREEMEQLSFLMIRRPPRSTQSRSSAASDVYKRQLMYLLANFAE